MLELLKNACASVTPENWASIVNKTKYIIFSDWDREIEFDNIPTQELIINTANDSRDDSSSYEESDDSL